MNKFWRRFTALGAISWLIVGTGSGANAVTASYSPKIMKPRADLISKWGNVRDELQHGKQEQALSVDVMDILAGMDLRENLEEAIRLTYAVARPEEISRLDDLWLETLIANGDSHLISRYLAQRSVMQMLPENGGQSYMKRWLWLAKADGDCDGDGGPSGTNNGFGNGDQDAPGGSEFTNGAENKGGNS